MDFLPALLITFSLIVALLCIQPLVWQIQHGNIPSSSLIAWIILANILNATNASIWPNADALLTYQGFILCDIEVKVWFACSTAVLGSFTALVRNLANIMDTSRMRNGASQSKRAKICDRVVTYGLCFAWPVFEMATSYLYQTYRYDLEAVIGCQFYYQIDWVAIFLHEIPVLVVGIAALVYESLILYRIHLYRRTIHTILSSSSSPTTTTTTTSTSTPTRANFLRLIILSLIILLPCVPLTLLTTIYDFLFLAAIHNLGPASLAYNFGALHADFDTVLVDLTQGIDGDPSAAPGQARDLLALGQRYSVLVAGAAVFAFLGCYRDAWVQWRGWGVACREAGRKLGSAFRGRGDEGQDGGQRQRQRLQSEHSELSTRSWDRSTSSSLIASWRVSIASRTKMMLSSLGLSRLGALASSRKASKASRGSKVSRASKVSCGSGSDKASRSSQVSIAWTGSSVSGSEMEMRGSAEEVAADVDVDMDMEKGLAVRSAAVEAREV